MFITIVAGLLVYPTMIWTGVLSIFMIYWLLVAGGARDAVDNEADDDVNLADKSSLEPEPSDPRQRYNTNEATGLLGRIGRSQIPRDVIGTVIAALNFIGCQIALHRTGPVGYGAGVVLLAGVFIASLAIAMVVLWSLHLCVKGVCRFRTKVTSQPESPL